MRKLFSMLCKQNGAMSLGRVLIFLFGLEILAIIPIITIWRNFSFWIFLVFFFVLFLSVIYSKTVDAKIEKDSLSVNVKDGENNDNNTKPQ